MSAILSYIRFSIPLKFLNEARLNSFNSKKTIKSFLFWKRKKRGDDLKKCEKKD